MTILSITLQQTTSLTVNPTTQIPTEPYTDIYGSGQIETDQNTIPEPPDNNDQPTNETQQTNQTRTTESTPSITNTTDLTIKINIGTKHITNNAQKIGISINTIGQFHKKQNYITFIIPEHLGNYTKLIKNLANMTDKTILETRTALHKLKKKFKNTYFENKPRKQREKICSEPAPLNKTLISENVTQLCQKYAYNSIIKRALSTNTEAYRTTNLRINNLETKMHNIMETFTSSENRKRRSIPQLSFVGNFEKWAFDMATGEDLRQVQSAINQIENAQETITSTLSDVVILNDWTKEHLLNVDAAVRELQGIIINLGTSIETKINQIGLENNAKYLINIAATSITSTAFLNINNICITLENEIQRLSNSIEESINGNLNIDTIAPNDIFTSIKKHTPKLKANERFLWQEKEDIIKIYKHAETNIYRCRKGKKLMITFKIPVIDKDTETVIKEINILPFTPTKQSDEIIVNIGKDINQIYIIELDNQLFHISRNDIPKGPTDVYKKDKLNRISQRYTKCLNNILTENTTKILENCGTKKSTKDFSIIQSNTSSYIFYAKNTTKIELQCPVTDQTNRTKIYKENLIGYGTLMTPEYCTLKTPETTFLGKPIELASMIIERKEFNMTKLITHEEIDTDLLTKIIDTQNELNKQDLIKLVKQIESIEPLNNTAYKEATTKLREDIIEKIRRAEKQLSKARELLKYFNKEIEPTLGSLIILFVILISILLYICIKMNKKPKTRHFEFPKYTTTHNINRRLRPTLELKSLKRKRGYNNISNNSDCNSQHGW